MKFEIEQLFSLPEESKKHLNSLQRLEQTNPLNVHFCGYTGNRFVTDKTEYEIKGAKFKGESPNGKWIYDHFDRSEHLHIFVPYEPTNHGQLTEWYETGAEIPGMFTNSSYQAIHIHPNSRDTRISKGEINYKIKKD